MRVTWENLGSPFPIFEYYDFAKFRESYQPFEPEWGGKSQTHAKVLHGHPVVLFNRLEDRIVTWHFLLNPKGSNSAHPPQNQDISESKGTLTSAVGMLLLKKPLCSLCRQSLTFAASGSLASGSAVTKNTNFSFLSYNHTK